MQYDLDRILPAIVSEPEIETRLSATVALQHFLQLEEQQGRTDWEELIDRVLPSLLHAIGDPFKGVQVHASNALELLVKQSPRVMETLRKTMRADDAWRAWGAAIVAGRMGIWSPEAGQALGAAMGGPDRDVRWAAASYMLKFARTEPAAIAVVHEVLCSGNLEARKMAAYCLGAIGAFAPVADALQGALADEAMDVRRAAILALDKLPATPAEAKARIAEMAESDPNEYVRRTAAAVAAKG